MKFHGCAEAMRDHAAPVEHPGLRYWISWAPAAMRRPQFNISTTAAMVLAAGGVKVAKHGNRGFLQLRHGGLPEKPWALS